MKFSLRRSRKSPTNSTESLLFVTTGAALLLLAARPVGVWASDDAPAKTLGGPVMARPTIALANPAAAPDTPPPARDATETATNPPAALGPLAYDLATIRQLKVAGQSLDDLPLRVGNLDILAPLVPQLPRIGASASRVATTPASGDTKAPVERSFQINLPQGSPIVLTIGSTVAKIAGQEQQLRAAPLVIRDKIWMPVFSLAPLLGAATRLEQDGTLHLNPTVQSVELFPVKGALALTVKTSMPVSPGSVTMGTLDDPPKLYLDFSGYSMGFDAAGSTAERTVSTGLGNVEKVRVGMFQNFPDTTRVVLDLTKEMTGVNQPLPDKSLYALILLEPGKRLQSQSVLNTGPTRGSLRGITIVVDAGHGGHDFGALGARSQEKYLTLTIASMLRNELMERGATVLMSRDDDRFISLQGRVDFANSHNADIFFSVHINSFQKTSAGTETFYYTPQSLNLAQEVHKELVKATGVKSRGVSQARFFVIRKTWMPSILTESAFITNPNEEALLVDPKWQQRVAQGMAQGISNYVQNYMRGGLVAG